MYKRILAAIDWTSGADAVVDQTRQLAELTGAAVHILHVQPMNVPSPPALSTLANHALTAGPAPGDAVAAAHQMVGEAVAVLDAVGVHAEGTVLETPPGDTPRAVLQLARDLRADLIVLGARHHGWLSAAFRSSVADEVSHHAGCPILIVP